MGTETVPHPLRSREIGSKQLVIVARLEMLVAQFSLIVIPKTGHASKPVVTFHASRPKSVRWPDKSPCLRHQRNGILISISLDIFWISDQPELKHAWFDAFE
jgi:hypothetical protein